MERALREIGIEEIVPGEANFLMFHVDGSQRSAREVIEQAREMGVFVRDVANMGSRLGERALRIAIKDPVSNEKVLRALKRSLFSTATLSRNAQPVAIGA